MKLKHWYKSLLIFSLVLATPGLLAADVEFIQVQSVFQRPASLVTVYPYAINLESSARKIDKNSIRNLDKMQAKLLYVTQVKINKKTYYRLATGNFKTQSQANKQLSKVRKFYPGAWIGTRSILERQKLSAILKVRAAKPPKLKKITPKRIAKPRVKKKPVVGKLSAEELLKQAKEKFLQGEYTRVLAIADKVFQTGSEKQQQQALELSGIVRERRRQFAQAIAIYNEFLTRYPDSPMADKIKSRIAGLKTMRLEPRAKLTQPEKSPDQASWGFNGSLSQYYRNDVIEDDNGNSEEVTSTLLTDVNFFASRKTETDALQFRFDGGIGSDFIDKTNDSRISRALISYTNNASEILLTAGRQTRTAKGIFGRFDGLVFTGLSQSSFNYSLFTGYPVQSSYDGVESATQFVGGSIHYDFAHSLAMDVYLLQQQVSDLTDREVLGTELQYRTDRGFLYGIIDYDLFFKELNNVTAIGNFQMNEQWVLNLTYDNRYAPLLSTSNALQGQPVASIEELKNTLSDEQIYQLARDTTTKSQNLFAGSSYQIDENHQLYLSLSLTSIDETVNIASSDDIHIAADYSIQGYFSNNDFTTFGIRLSDTSSAETLSLRTRTRIAGAKSLRYDPRINLDLRKSKITEVEQWILRPSLRVTYKPSRNLSLEATLGIELSEVDLPGAEQQSAYNLTLGYIYYF